MADIHAISLDFKDILMMMSTGLSFCALLFSRARDDKEEIKSIKNKINSHGEQISAIESAIENGVTKSDLIAIQKQIYKISGEVAVVGEMSKRFTAVEKNVSSLVEALIR